MAKQKTSGQPKRPAPKPQREVDKLFARYAAYHQNSTNKLLQIIFVPLFLLGIYGLLWAIPFPKITFLGKYADHLNFASFLMAVCVFMYYRLSPVLSYFILFTFFFYSLIISQLLVWQENAGGALWQVCLVFTVIGLAGMLIGYAAEKKNPGVEVKLSHILIAPIYLWHLALNKFSIKF
ncbi:MAG: Mpo1-like protein [Mucilaginibacter sp.]